MEELKSILAEMLSEQLYHIIISSPKRREGTFKIKIRPVLLQDKLLFQETVFEETKVFHENYEKRDMLEKIAVYMEEEFKQLEAETTESRLTALVSKKGRLTLKRQKKKPETAEYKPDLSHNRAKKYILEEGKQVPFLVDLGVMTAEGKIVRAKYDKFKQINRYLEFVEDILPVFSQNKCIHIIDFGCGKSYLTFALYYYLHELKGYEVSITGLDLKKEVIERCNLLAEKYGYGGLRFIKGDIAEFTEAEAVDMVVTLHACDTATDYALKKAVDWGAKVIFSVPCCQHEVNKQIKNEEWEPILKYGLIKERMSALITDAVRANLLEEKGYETQILEFIDMEHTPKNILIRAVKGESEAKAAAEKETDSKIRCITEALQIETTLQRLFDR